MWEIILLMVITGIIVIFKDNADKRKNTEKTDEVLNNRNFKTTRKFRYELNSNIIEFRTDMQNKQIAICEIKQQPKIDIIKFEKVVDCEIIQDSNVIMKGGVGRAIVGGAIAGGVGAIVGATTRKSTNIIDSLQIRIIANNTYNPLYMLKLISTQTQKDSIDYQKAIGFANNVHASLISIINTKEELVAHSDPKTNLVENLEKLAELKKSGIITEEEFENTKRRIFNNNEPNLTQQVPTNNFVNLILVDIGSQKIPLVSLIKNELGVGLKDALDIVDTAPSLLLANVDKETAECLGDKLTQMGAIIQIENL